MSKQILVGSNFPGFKNRIINGDFQVWQRGESFTFEADVLAYTVDRFYSKNNSDGEYVISKSTLLDKNSAKLTVNTAVTDLTADNYWQGFSYKFEGQHLYDLAVNGKDITISFWFNSNVTGKYSVALSNLTDIATNIQSYVTEFEYATANTPQKVEITIPLNVEWNPALQNDENTGLQLTICFLNQGDYSTDIINEWQDGNYLTTPDCVNWGTTDGNYIEIAELQLEEGNIATEFEKVPYDIQLLRCMRFYEKIGGNKYFLKYVDSDKHYFTPIYFKAEKRVIPTIVNCQLSNTNIVLENPAFYTSLEAVYVYTKSSDDNPVVSGATVTLLEADAEL